MPELPECKQQLVVRTGFLEEGIQPDVWLMRWPELTAMPGTKDDVLALHSAISF